MRPRPTLTAIMLAVCAATPAAAQEAAPRSAQLRFEHSRMAEAGFSPIEEVTAQVREVRRLRLADPYGGLPLPAIEVQRRADGGVFLRLQHRGWSLAPVAADRALWDELAALEPALFAPPPPAPARPAVTGPPPAPPPVCHGWSALIMADETRTAWWTECGNREGPALDYTRKVVAAVMATRPDCEAGTDSPFFAYARCFGDQGQFDDQALGARVAAFRKAYGDEPGADYLMRARMALQKPMRLGDPAWIAAREAIAALEQSNARRRAQLTELILASRRPAGTTSAADAARMEAMIRNWRDFIASQEVNYSQLLKQLTDVPAATAPGSPG